MVCIDEVYTKNSDFDHSKYSCLFYDFYNKTLIDVTPSRKKEYLLSYLENNYSKKELDNVKYVSIDMYQTYKSVASLRFKNAIICVDSFHVIKTLNDCVQKIRMRVLNKYDSSSQEYYLLKKWKNLFLGSNIEEFTDFISVLGNWDTEITNSFIVYKGRRISNGIAESINSRVSTAIFISKGIRNSDRRKKRIMYAINKGCLTL